MPQGVGALKELTGHASDTFGGKLFGVADYSGPKAYVQGGDLMDSRGFGFPNNILSVIGSLDTTKTYRLEPRPLQKGLTPWQMVWTVYATGAEVAAGVDLSGFTAKLTAFGI